MAINAHEAKTHLSQLLARVAAGESITITEAGKPIAKLVPIQTPTLASLSGCMAGEFTYPEDFNEPDQTIESLFGLNK